MTWGLERQIKSSQYTKFIMTTLLLQSIYYFFFLLVPVTAFRISSNTSNPLSRKMDFPEITISGINCNSLNISTIQLEQYKKTIYGITKLKTDVIFLSDIRLSSRNLISCKSDLEKEFLINPYRGYKCYFNSNRNSRGTGVLVVSDVDHEVVETIADPNDNFILLRIRFGEIECILGSIYGPNIRDENFVRELDGQIARFNNLPVVIGGDWNATFSVLPIDQNPDCQNMRTIPNAFHLELIQEICQSRDLTDPFRVLYPNNREYTYVPRNRVMQNKSRLDFFLVLVGLLPSISDTFIESNLQSKAFDHKAIILSTVRPMKKSKGNPRISNVGLCDPAMDLVVLSSVIDCYLSHVNVGNNQLREVIDRWQLAVGNVKRLLRAARPPVNLILDPLPDNAIKNRETILDEARNICQDLNLGWLESLELTTNPDMFMEAL